MERLCGTRIKSKSPPSTGKFKESVCPIRVTSRVVFAARTLVYKTHNRIPLYSASIQAGYPEAIDDNTSMHTSLESVLFQNTEGSLTLLVQDNSLVALDIFYGDALIINPKKSYYTHDIMISQEADKFYAQQNINSIEPLGAVQKIIRKIL